MSSLKYVAKRSRLSLEVDSGATVHTLLGSVREVDEKLFRAVLDHSGELNPGIIVLVNERDIDVLQGLVGCPRRDELLNFCKALKIHAGEL
ncbi:MAG: hypothetical protein ACTSSA_09745 [Candidatus Freyarchaeota archaeon]